MAVPKAPPRAVQQRLYGKALFGPVPSADQWEYAIAKDWLDQYKEKVFDKNTEALNMYPLFVSSDGQANIFIGESWWKILVSWYGTAEDSVLLRRPTFPQYIPVFLLSGQDNIFPNKELDFLQVSVGRLEHLQNPKHYHYIQIYFWEQFVFLELVARYLLKIAQSSNVRLWVLVSAGGHDTCFKCIDKSIMAWFGTLGSFLCAENETVLNEMRTRQAIILQGMPPDAPPECMRASSNEHLPDLDDVFEQFGLVITICIEELSPQLTNLGTSAITQQDSTILGEVAQFVHSTVTPQSDWDEALKEGLQQLTCSVSEIVKSNTTLIYDHTTRIVGDKVVAVEKEQQDLEEKLKKLTAKEEQLNVKEEKLNEREADFEKKMAKFKQNLTNFLTEKKKLEDELKRIENQNKISESKVELNIGGMHFTTSTSTLTQEQDSVLAFMFNGRNAVHREKDGSYFIDRDGTHFRYILNFLREGTTAVESFPSEPRILKELLTEAKYYHLESLIKALEEKLRVSNAKKL